MGDSQAPGHQAAGSTPSAGACEHALAAGKPDHVIYNEKIVRESHAGDHIQFVLQAFAVPFRNVTSQPPVQAGFCEPDQKLPAGESQPVGKRRQAALLHGHCHMQPVFQSLCRGHCFGGIQLLHFFQGPELPVPGNIQCQIGRQLVFGNGPEHLQQSGILFLFIEYVGNRRFGQLQILQYHVQPGLAAASGRYIHHGLGCHKFFLRFLQTHEDFPDRPLILAGHRFFQPVADGQGNRHAMREDGKLSRYRFIFRRLVFPGHRWIHAVFHDSGIPGIQCLQTLVVFCQHQKPHTLDFRFQSEHRFHVCVPAGMIKLHDPIHGIMIRDRGSSHPCIPGTLHNLFRPQRAFQEGTAGAGM